MKKIQIILAFVLFLGLISSVSAKTFRADDKNITYVGRVETLADGSVRFDWCGVNFNFQFTGKYCAIRLSDTQSSFYCVFLDGKQMEDFNVKSKDTLLVLPKNLSKGTHTLKIFKRSEAGMGMTTVHEVVLADDGKLLPVSALKRKIEFIGDSITCGFGVNSNDPNEKFSAATENAYNSFASLTARYFNADCTLIAHSGQGVVRNYGDANSLSAYTMKQRFLTLYDTKEDMKWDFSKWKPDVVIINLGTNDFSTQPYPTKDDFVKGYTELIASVRNVYGENIPIICLSATMSNENQRECLETLSKEQKGKNLYYVPMREYLVQYPTEVGCGHPNAKGQKKIANVLIPYVSSIMNWEY